MQDAVLEADARAKEAEATAVVQLKNAWASSEPGGKKQKLRMKNFDDFAAHKSRKREHKKSEQARREREEAEDARLEAEEEAAAAAAAIYANPDVPAESATSPAPMDIDGNSGGGDAPVTEITATLAAAGAALHLAMSATPEEAHREKIRKQVAAYVHSQLKARVKDAAENGGKKMSREECKRLEGKVSAKVVDSSSSLRGTGVDAQGGGRGGKEDVSFLTSKRKEKIKSLIASYLAQGKKGVK